MLEELPDYLRAYKRWVEWEKHAKDSPELITGVLSQLCYLGEKSPGPELSAKQIKGGLGEFREHVMAMRERELLKTPR